MIKLEFKTSILQEKQGKYWIAEMFQDGKLIKQNVLKSETAATDWIAREKFPFENNENFQIV